MANFDMRGQHVTNQYNAGRDMNFGAVQTPVDLITELEKFKEAILAAKTDGILDKKKATDVEYQVTKAAEEAEEPKPDKKSIIDYLTTAKTILEGVVATGGLVTALASAIQIVQKVFS